MQISFCDEWAATVQAPQRSSSKRRRRRSLERDNDEERLIVRDRAFSRMHESSLQTVLMSRSHNNFSETSTKWWSREAYEDRKNHHSHWSASSRLLYNILDHCWILFSRAQAEHEKKHSDCEKKAKDLTRGDMIVWRAFDKKTWSFWSLHGLFDKRLGRFEAWTSRSMIRTRQSEKQIR